MAPKAEFDLDASLAALARDLGEAAPRPGADLTAGVMADAALTALVAQARAACPAPSPHLVAGVLADAALTSFAAEARAAAPRPDQALVARVLADAASVAAGRAATLGPRPALAQAAGGRARSRLGAWLSDLTGWTGGAVAAMALGLVVGLGLGLEATPGSLPVLEPAASDPLSIAELEPAMFLVEGP